MRLSRRGDYNTWSKEYFLVEDDDRGMPRSDASEKQTDLIRHEQACHMPSICLPTTCMDITLTMPLLRSYTYSFTGDGMSVIKSVAEEVTNKYTVCQGDASLTRPSTTDS
jgi:hypothetical protein